MRVFALPRPAYPGRRRCSLCRRNFKIKYHWLPTHGMRWSSQKDLKLITCETDNNCCNTSRQVQHSNPVLEGQLTLVTVFKPGYKFFWIGRHSEELREVGMGFSVRIDLINFTKTFSKDSVMASYYDTIISAYAPTMTTQQPLASNRLCYRQQKRWAVQRRLLDWPDSSSQNSTRHILPRWRPHAKNTNKRLYVRKLERHYVRERYGIRYRIPSTWQKYTQT